MKTIPMEARTALLLVALSIGFGLAFHALFFVIAAGIALLLIWPWTLNELHKFLVHFRRKTTLRH